ncbi:MAG: translation initiation factor IF-3 [Bdellovibrionia bacterium]
MAFIPSSPSSPSSPSGPPSFPRPRFPRGPIPNQNKDEHRLNERIRVPQVRLIDEKGNQVGVVQTFEALQMARERGLDLMEVSPNAQPPVCKICDYGKFKYEKKKKEQVAKKKQTVIKVKEIQLRPQTEEHDLDYKFRSVRQFLIDGDKAKITIMFRGREITYVDHGFKIMKQLADLVKDIGSVESPPKIEGKKLIMVLAPGASKKTVSTGSIVKVTPTKSPVIVSGLPIPNVIPDPDKTGGKS